MTIKDFVPGLFLVLPLAAAADIEIEQRKVPLNVPRAATPITVDAHLDEPAWQTARRVTLPYETWPAENVPAKAETEGFVTYDTDNLYIAIIAHDPDPSQIRAHLSDRDRLFQDDFVGVIFDTFNDERRGFEFFVNPLGVQADLFVDDVNGGEDPSYDVIWDSAGRITEQGYVVEMAIPFRSLRFRNGGGDQVWGIDFRRIYPRGERHQFRSYKADRDLACTLCEFQKFRGFAGVDPGNNIELMPTVTAFRTQSRPGYRQPFGDAQTEVEPGLDLSWGITPNVILNATLNPDFSQVEADSAQLDVNNQFALFFPERRPFFLEGQDLFEDAFNLVYTRNIADPDYGAKVTGKEGSHAFGAFVTDDQMTNLLFPGAQGSRFASFDFASRNAAARYRYDLGDNSTVGAITTQREGGGYRSTTYAFDTLYRFTQSDKLRVEFAGSNTEYPQQMADDYVGSQRVMDDNAWHVEYERRKREYDLRARHAEIGEDFRADLGFLPQVGYRKSTFGGGYNWHGEDDDWYRRLRLSGDYDVTLGTDGQELERELEVSFNFSGRLQSRISPELARRRQFFDGVTYYQTVKSVYAEIKPSGTIGFGGYARHGDAIDYANSRPGTVFRVEPWVSLRFGRHLAINLNHRHQRLDVAGGRLFTADISEVRATWQFNTRTFLRWISQYRDVERDQSLYVDPVDERSRQWFNQVLFSYKINPRTLIFAGYSDGSGSVDDNPLQQQTQTVFLKLSYAWQL